MTKETATEKAAPAKKAAPRKRPPIEDVDHRVTVPGSPATAFKIFNEKLPEWWPNNFRVTKVGAPLGVDVGEKGRIYEIDEAGEEHTFGTIRAYEPPTRLVVAWHLNGFGRIDPDDEHATEFEVTFSPSGSTRTEVAVHHAKFENMGTQHARRVRNGMDKGWPTILERFSDAVKAAKK
jgi:uncharacterized protein YndB with AHSA1/START domain